MFIYLITAEFRKGNIPDYNMYRNELERAIDSFNLASRKNKKGALLRLIDVTKGNFKLSLESQAALKVPSKALVKFSQALAQEPAVQKFTAHGNQMVKSTKTEYQESPQVQLTDGQLLAKLVDIVHNNDLCSNPKKLRDRRDLLDNVKAIVQAAQV